MSDQSGFFAKMIHSRSDHFKNTLVTLILFELGLFWYLAQAQILGNSLYKPEVKNVDINGINKMFIENKVN